MHPATRLWRATALIALSTIVGAACGGESGEPRAATVSEETAGEVAGEPDPSVLAGDGAAADSGASEGALLLDFQAEQLDGSTLDVARFSDTDVVVWFWEPH